MAKVSFWSMDKAMAGNTHAILAVATLMGITHKVTNILIQANYNSKKVESAFTPYDDLVRNGIFENANTGISALSRLVISNKLTPDFIQNYAKPALKGGRLDVLYGVNSKDKEMYEQIMNSLTYLLRKADEIYDLVFVDLPKGTADSSITNTLADSDAIVCVLNQDIVKLSNFFSKIDQDETLKDKQKIYVIADYDDKAKYNAYNIASRFKLKEPLYTVPHNAFFASACNDGNLTDFLYANLNHKEAGVDKNDYNAKFFIAVDEIVQKILEVTKIKEN